MDFPIKADFFPQVRLSMDERAKYLRTAEASAVALRRVLDSSDWTKLFDKDGASFSKMHCIDEHQPTAHGGAATACLAVCATIFTPGTISEVLEAIASPVTDDYRKAMKFIYKNRFLDGLALHTIAAQNAQAFTTIKWAAFDDGKARNSPKFPAGSDYCFLEHAGIQREDGGADDADDTFGFSVQESVVRDREVPSLAGFGLRRGEFHRTGIIIRATERRDVVQVSSILQMRLLGSDSAANKAALERLMLKRVEAVGRVDLLLERRRLNKMQFINRDEWVADEDRKSCAVCDKPFSIRRRHHCRNCGEVVCSTCAPPREVDVSSYGSALIRICTACVVQARSEPHQQAQAGADVFVYHVRSTVSSRTSTNSSTMTMEAELGGAVRPHSFGSDSNFSIASEYQHSVVGDFFPPSQPPPPLSHPPQAQQQAAYSSFLDPYDVASTAISRELDARKNCSRDSQSSSDGSSYSFSDLNTFDDRFGSAVMKRQAPQATPARSTGASSHRRVLFNGPQTPPPSQPEPRATGSAVFNPAKVVTHLLTNDSAISADPNTVGVAGRGIASTSSASAAAAASGSGGGVRELSSSFQSTGSLDEDFQECVRGLEEDICRATSTRFSDLAAAESFSSDLTSFHSDLLSANTGSTTNTGGPAAATSAATTTTLAASVPAPPPQPRSVPLPKRRVDTDSACSSPSTVDVDIEMLLSSDDFSLLCPETLQRQQRSSSLASLKQAAGETRRSAATPRSAPAADSETVPRVTPPLRGSSLSRDSTSSVLRDDDEDLLALRLQVEGLHKSLEAATSKLNYYQSLSSTRSTRTLSTDSDVAVAPLPRNNWHGDPAFGKRTATYDALVSELHELMGLPTLSPRAARGY
ncbi:hypothetical protein PybrP1_011318 [[Pythium] brassicae (nom. inval.)]|nr:hypothetical protein PybrP1_011318 [[Pythium] brassicae (nom. inval.)]